MDEAKTIYIRYDINTKQYFQFPNKSINIDITNPKFDLKSSNAMNFFGNAFAFNF